MENEDGDATRECIVTQCANHVSRCVECSSGVPNQLGSYAGATTFPWCVGSACVVTLTSRRVYVLHQNMSLCRPRSAARSTPTCRYERLSRGTNCCGHGGRRRSISRCVDVSQYLPTLVYADAVVVAGLNLDGSRNSGQTKTRGGLGEWVCVVSTTHCRHNPCGNRCRGDRACL